MARTSTPSAPVESDTASTCSPDDHFKVIGQDKRLDVDDNRWAFSFVFRRAAQKKAGCEAGGYPCANAEQHGCDVLTRAELEAIVSTNRYSPHYTIADLVTAASILPLDSCPEVEAIPPTPGAMLVQLMNQAGANVESRVYAALEFLVRGRLRWPFSLMPYENELYFKALPSVIPDDPAYVLPLLQTFRDGYVRSAQGESVKIGHDLATVIQETLFGHESLITDDQAISWICEYLDTLFTNKNYTPGRGLFSEARRDLPLTANQARVVEALILRLPNSVATRRVVNRAARRPEKNVQAACDSWQAVTVA